MLGTQLCFENAINKKQFSNVTLPGYCTGTVPESDVCFWVTFENGFSCELFTNYLFGCCGKCYIQ